MKELAAKSKRPSQPFPRPALLPPKHQPCQPKPQPNFGHLTHLAHPRREDPRREELKENRGRQNEAGSTRGKGNVLLKDQRRSHQSTQEDAMRRTQKKLRAHKGRTEWVAVEEEDALGCHERLHPHHSHQDQEVAHTQPSRPAASRTATSARRLPETGARRMSDAEMLLEFERGLGELGWRQESERLAETVRREEEDSRGPADYLPRQPHLTWLNRAFVLNWMMLLASELHCRREVLANAASLFDRYLAISPPVQLDRLQLLAAGCLFLAEKLQDNTRISASSFWQPISERHSQEQLLGQQVQVAVALGFRLRSPTVNSWANRLCAQWDLYVSGKEGSGEAAPAVRFKSGTPESYQNFRMLAELIDLSLLDIQTRHYKNRTLAAAFLFLTVLLRLGVHTPQEVAARFRTNSQLILAGTPINRFFSTFLLDSFGFPLAEILPAVQYASVFVVLPLGEEMPQVEREGEPMSFEEYCGLQTFNPHQKATLAKLNRHHW